LGLGATEIEAADAEEAVAAIRAGQTRVVGKRTPPRFFIGNTVQSICLIFIQTENTPRSATLVHPKEDCYIRRDPSLMR